VEYGRVLRDAWSITVRTRVLWWLGAISAAQVVVYAAIVAGLAVPMAAMPQIASTIMATDAGAVTGSDAVRQQLVLSAAQWIGSHLAAIAMGAVAVFSVWIVLGVFDVAAQTGIVAQVAAVAEHRSASLLAGLHDGFRLWWRAVALLALAAMPSLAYLLVMALALFVTVTLPLLMGQPPKVGAALISNLVLSPLSGIASLVAVPLGVLVQLALRFAVVDNAEWRPAFRAAWRLAKANLAEIALTYALILLVTTIAVTAFSAFAAAAAAVGGVLLLGAALLATAGDSAAAGNAAAVGAVSLVGLLFLGFQAVVFVWQSSVWTLLWRDRATLGHKQDNSGLDHAMVRGKADPAIEGGI